MKGKKSHKEIGTQCERIFNLHVIEGYGTDKMLSKCEEVYLRYLSKIGY